MNTTEKLIEVKFNKKAWKKTKTSIIEKTMLSITFVAFIFLINSFIAMVEQWSISGNPLIINIICLAWLGIFAIYALVINK